MEKIADLNNLLNGKASRNLNLKTIELYASPHQGGDDIPMNNFIELRPQPSP